MTNYIYKITLNEEVIACRRFNVSTLIYEYTYGAMWVRLYL